MAATVGESKRPPEFVLFRLNFPFANVDLGGKLGSMRLLAGVLTLSAAIVLGIAAYEAVPAPSHGPASGIVWHGQTFATRAAFARWLRSQGLTYRAWARSHPVGGVARRQKHSGWDPGVLAGIAAFLGALALGVTFVRRRWPESGAAAAHLIGVMGLRGAAAIGAGARTTSRWAAPTIRRSMERATAAASRAWHGAGVTATHRVEAMRVRGAAAAEAGARRTRRRAALTARKSMAFGTAAASGARHGIGGSVAHWFDVAALRGVAAAEAGARRTRRRAALTVRRSTAFGTAAASGARHGIGGSAAHRFEVAGLRGGGPGKGRARRTRRRPALTARRLTALATAAVFNARRRRSELAWYVTTALLAAGLGVVVTVWLNRGP